MYFEVVAWRGLIDPSTEWRDPRLTGVAQLSYWEWSDSNALGGLTVTRQGGAMLPDRWSDLSRLYNASEIQFFLFTQKPELQFYLERLQKVLFVDQVDLPVIL